MDGCLVIVPTNRRIRHLTREILRLSENAVAPALALHTLESLCRLIYQTIPGARHVTGGAARTLLFQQAVGDVASRLRYFSLREGKVNLPRGTFEKLADVIVLLKESGITPDTLDQELLLAGGEETAKLADVTAVYRSYEQRCNELGVEDLEGIYRVLASDGAGAAFSSGFRTLFPDVEMVSLAGFDEFSLPEIGILRNLCAIPGLTVIMMFDFLQGNSGLFGHLEENYRLLMELGFREVRDERETAAAAFFFGSARKPPAVRNAADSLARTLFAPAPAQSVDLSPLVTVMAGRSRLQEVELICKLIKRLAAERPGRALSRICVALRSPELYTDIMREQFARYGIPVNITDRFDLARSPVVTSLLGLLALPLRGFRREDLLRAAGAPYVTIPAGMLPFDGGNVAAVASRVRGTAGIHAWGEKIERAIVDAERREKSSGDRGGMRRAADEVRSLRKGRNDIDALGEVLRPFTRPMTAADFEREFLLLMDRLSVAKNLIDPQLRSLPDLVEKDIRAYTDLRELLRQITGIIEVQGGGGVAEPLQLHLERLKTAIGRERYNTREVFGRGVLVTSIEETRELPVDVMIVAGLVDGEFPSPYQPEVFLSARRRKEREQRQRWENRYLFYQAVTNWTEQLYVTYPLRDAGVDLVRSSFVDALMKAARVRLWDRTGLIPFADDCSAPEEFLQLFGAGLRNGAESTLAIPPGLEDDCAVVRRAVRAEQSRTVTHVQQEFEGNLASVAATTAAEYFAGQRGRVYSSSQLETYAECPFRFFGQNVLRLVPTEEYEEGMTAAEKGSLLHETLFEFFRSRRDRNLPPLHEVSDEDFRAAVDEAVGIARGKLEALDIPDVFWKIEKELLLGGPSGEGILERYLRFERNREEPVRPSYFEVSFGGTPGGEEKSDSDLSTQEPVQFGPVRLRGKVDRVDVGEGFFSVVDYKTGSVIPRMKDIIDGTSLQIPIYLHAIEELLHSRGSADLVPAGGFYCRIGKEISMNPGIVAAEFRGRAFPAGSRSKQTVQDEKELRGVIAKTKEAVGKIVDGIASGAFPLTRPELVARVCAYCDFKTICRIQIMKNISPEEAEET